MPNRRKPLAIKKVQGTVNAALLPKNLATVVDGFPPPPHWLSARAAEIYQEHQAMIIAANVHSAVDSTMLTMLAMKLEEIEICSALIEDQGRMIVHETGDRTVYMTNPAIRQRTDAVTQVRYMLNDFGLTPSARVKVAANGPAKKANAFLDF